MRRFAPISLTVLPLLLAAACGSAEQVPENGDLETQPMEISSELYPATAGGAAEARSGDRFGGNSWVYRPAERAALYGPPESEAIFAMTCRDPASGELAVARYVPAALGAQGVLSFSGNNRTASVAVVSEPLTEGSDSIWQGNVTTDLGRFREVFAGDTGTVAIGISTGAEIVAPVSDAPLRAIDACMPA